MQDASTGIAEQPPAHHRVGIFDGLLIGIRDFQGGQILAITQCVQDLLR